LTEQEKEFATLKLSLRENAPRLYQKLQEASQNLNTAQN